MEFRDFKYEVDHNAKRLSVESTIEKTLPYSIGKFILLDEKKVITFTNCKLYASSIDQLNDIFECRGLYALADRLSHKSSILTGRDFEESKSIFRAAVNSNYGIISFCNQPKNDAMWGLYGKHKGIFVQFDTQKLLKSIKHPDPTCYISNLAKVRYEKDMNEFATELAQLESDDIKVISLHTKRATWTSEEEYRIVLNLQNRQDLRGFKTIGNLSLGGIVTREVDFSMDAISYIVLGFHFFDLSDNPIRKFNTMYFSLDDSSDFIKKKLLDFCIENHIQLYIPRIDESEMHIYEIVLSKHMNSYRVEHNMDNEILLD